jgi:RNA polymerase sigma-70 factor (ECF subfamily)
MVEDKLLMWRFKRGSGDALARIYEKYKGYLLTLASVLLNDVNSAEDVVHDFFVSFAQSADRLRLDGNLRGYLATCVANRARDRIRARQRQPIGLDQASSMCSHIKGPELSAVYGEELDRLARTIDQLPNEQWEVVALRIKGRMKFRQIAKLQNSSIKTVQSRYRYGLQKLRLILNSEVEK